MATSCLDRRVVSRWNGVKILAATTALLASSHALAGRIDAIAVACRDGIAAGWGGDDLALSGRESPRLGDEPAAATQCLAPPLGLVAPCAEQAGPLVEQARELGGGDEIAQESLLAPERALAGSTIVRDALHGSGAAEVNDSIDVPSWFRRLRLGTRTRAFVFYLSPSIPDDDSGDFAFGDVLGLKSLFRMVDDRFAMLDASY